MCVQEEVAEIDRLMKDVLVDEIVYAENFFKDEVVETSEDTTDNAEENDVGKIGKAVSQTICGDVEHDQTTFAEQPTFTAAADIDHGS